MELQNRKDDLELLYRFLDGELTPEQEKQALHIIAENDELRELLRFDKFLKESFTEEPKAELFSIPEHFTDEVMDRIEQMDAENAPAYSWSEKIFDMVRGWFAPRQYTFRPALVYVIPAVLLFVYTGFFQGGMQPSGLDVKPVGMDSGIESSTQVQYISESQSAAEEVWIRFVYIDENADQIAVAGNFSNWEPVEMTSQEMKGKKVWTGLVPVERGEHHYMFIKDGEEWVSDPLAEVLRDDGFGNKNAVIYL
jgi:hypothetical protein